ncbi:dihydropteroate synthase [Rhodocytophaga aerolata]|uniref:dihydropteroate synthase n=1 Tax=Rhodocytophaga aerolata TaxID=455078 RepID=A0ABT8R9M5_9BACT|nr:dihydropteroate synthase [Rhodocytophaga aerolata]MDO1447385.1 dihydropteroate synthase [Rhodocytophaga aerolata]
MPDTRDSVFRTNSTLRLRGNLLDLSAPLVMGILNITPDSFYAGSRASNVETAVERAGQMITDGATILDIGGYSSRPGASAISLEEELDRVLPVIEAILHQFPDTYISIDTFRAEVARQSVEAGACLVNDISGGSLDDRMFETVASLQVPYVVMHMRGTPQTMKLLTSYENLLKELIDYFQQKVYQLRQANIKDIILDVGFGFAKAIEQNYFLLKNMEVFQILGLPLLAGLSRKSLIYKKLNIPVSESLNGTTVLNTLALTKGASILRVHDVKEAVETVKLFQAYND